MDSLNRHLYRTLLRLHPAEFRNAFARDMLLDFEEASRFHGPAPLFRDALMSLARQWFVHIAAAAPEPVAVSSLSLLAGDYIMIRDKAFTPLELLRGLIGSTALIALCVLGVNTRPRHPVASTAAYAASAPSKATSDSGRRSMLKSGGGNSPKARSSQSTERDLAQIEDGSTPLRTAPPVALGGALAPSAPPEPKPELLLYHPAAPLPSYDVATIKLLNSQSADSLVKLQPGSFLSPLSVRRYIMNAYGAIYAGQIIGGPDWLNKDAFDIRGKIPDDLKAKLRNAPSQSSNDLNRAMQQSLLAERFHLQAHFETRILPVYALVPAKGGLRITAVPATQQRKPGDPPLPIGNALTPGTSRSSFDPNGLRILNAHAIEMTLLARIIASDAGAGDRPIVNRTGFNGAFDVTNLTWAPVGDAAADNQPDAPSLSVALEKTLGIKVVSTRAPIEVLVIDHIDRPSAN